MTSVPRKFKLKLAQQLADSVAPDSEHKHDAELLASCIDELFAEGHTVSAQFMCDLLKDNESRKAAGLPHLPATYGQHHND